MFCLRLAARVQVLLQLGADINCKAGSKVRIDPWKPEFPVSWIPVNNSNDLFADVRPSKKLTMPNFRPVHIVNKDLFLF